jgi:heavy metal sensor kinase
LPIKIRLTVAFAATIGVLLAIGGSLLYTELSRTLSRTTDNALRAQASLIEAGLGNHLNFADQGRSEIATFSQILDRRGRIIDSSTVVGERPLLGAPRLQTNAQEMVDTRVEGIPGTARLLVTPVSEGKRTLFVVVGASLASQAAVLGRFKLILFLGGPVGLALASTAGWALAGAALRPMERMRTEAAVISVSEPDRRLSVPTVEDEVSRLGHTLNSMLDRLQRAFVRERRFVDDASHELRTPLAILRAELDLGLSRARTPEEFRAALRGGLEETDRLTALANDLLVYSREEGGRLPLNRSIVRLDRFLERACGPFTKQGSDAGVRVDIEAHAVEVSVDVNRLHQAVNNLMSNALRHAPAGGRITVTATVVDSLLSLSVEDTGPGFEDGLLDRVFEPFARAAVDRAGSPTGTGLGLSIVQAVAELHGGRAVAENLPGGGARVSIAFLVPQPHDQTLSHH